MDAAHRLPTGVMRRANAKIRFPVQIDLRLKDIGGILKRGRPSSDQRMVSIALYHRDTSRLRGRRGICLG